VLTRDTPEDVPLGIYVHIPFCRKRCDFCYFKVYTDKNSKEIRRYIDAVLRELELFAQMPYLRGRKPSFVYFGGGTPSYLSADQMGQLFSGIQECFAWDQVEEVAFECEPGTLSEVKLQALFDLGVTRLSLGVENFDAKILKLNNRAHGADEIHRTYAYARKIGFDQVNLDLIAGMVGETDANWSRCIDETIQLRPESLTIYQMEVPYNTTLFKHMEEQGEEAAPVADWETKRRWTAEAFARMEAAGYHMGSAYTACLGDSIRFVYRDALWQGADMLGAGVSSFSHLGGVHFQNEHTFDAYVSRIESGEIPIARALALTEEERFRREFILQMKLGDLGTDYFKRKFGIDPFERFGAELAGFAEEGFLELQPERIRATRDGLLRIDSLLSSFFLEEHKNARYA
jgi:oxygen-independent coproporphyrinogen-3 oxidase